MKNEEIEKIANDISEQLISKKIPKGMKVRTLLKHFGYEKRTEENSTIITDILIKNHIMINPSIMKLGDTWKLKIDDRIYLVPVNTEIAPLDTKNDYKIQISDDDLWFNEILNKDFRTEKEVENKFILPLLSRLGYTDDDRFDGMHVNAANGSKQTKLIVDFALFNISCEELENQVLLVTEAKNESRLQKKVELENAQRQVKSYGIWLGCHFGLVTDSITIQIIDLVPKKVNGMKGMKTIFECTRSELKEKFNEIYNLISKKKLTEYYIMQRKENI